MQRVSPGEGVRPPPPKQLQRCEESDGQLPGGGYISGDDRRTGSNIDRHRRSPPPPHLTVRPPFIPYPSGASITFTAPASQPR